MFERFTDRSRKVMALANSEALLANHPQICTEHVLLGLLAEGSGVGAHVLKQMGVRLESARSEVEKLVKPGSGPKTEGRLPPSPLAEQVIKSAVEEARLLQHNYVGTEHLLLGLLRVRDGVAALVLTGLGLKLENVRNEVLATLGAAPLGPESHGESGGGSPSACATDTTEAATSSDSAVLSAGEAVKMLAQLLRRESLALAQEAASEQPALAAEYRDIADELDVLMKRLTALGNRRGRPGE